MDTEFSGTTMVAALVRGDQLHVYNVGDSRITMAVAEGDGVRAQQISIDHKPDVPSEKVRQAHAPAR